MELKGEIAWSSELHAELQPRGYFRVHTPGRTYYLQDAAAEDATAELWVQTISRIQARGQARAAAGAGATGAGA